MYKVRCTTCLSVGYTASPEHVPCKCGGKCEVIPEDGATDKEGK